jgi:deazaflavin-dependent oxidoreductase (nitroreductase family)
MPHDVAFKTMNLVHRGILKATGGRRGWKAMGMPVLELTTVGRHSGQPRSVMLTSPVQEGDTWVIVGSRGGDDHHPAWVFNIRANPAVEVAIGGEPRRPMTARVADAAERSRLWPLVIADHENYADYQRKTDREIPLVLLTPAGDTA